jgi:hypothetical protein
MRRIILLVALISMGTAANANTLVSGPLFNPAAQTAWCYFFNASGTKVSVSGRITNRFVGELHPTFNDCTIQQISPGGMCGILVNLPNTAANACTLVVSPSAEPVRAIFSLTTVSGSQYTPVASTELR